MTDRDGRTGGTTFPCASLHEALKHLRRPPAPEAVRFKIQNTAGDRAQVAAYELARRAERKREGRFLFHSVRRGPMRSGERCIVVPAPRSEARRAAIETRIAQTARQIACCIHSGDWPLSSPEGWWCSPGHCPAWASCPGGATGRAEDQRDSLPKAA